MGIGIAGVGHALPEKIVTNRDLEKMVETTDDWIRSRTGISERRVAGAETGTSVLASAAAKKALAAAGLKAEDVELVIVGTTTPDMPLPSCACFVQKAIGAKKAVCFDLAAACSGFIFALSTAHQFLKAKTYRNALVIGAEQISSFIDWTDRSTCVLFGDAAGAVVLTERPGRGILHTDLGSDGELADLITIPGGGSRFPASPKTLQDRSHYLKMNGAEVFKLAVRNMVASIENVIKTSGVKVEDIACIIPHQANMRIIEAVSDRLAVDPKRIFVNLEKYGNTSAASVVLALSEAHEQKKIRRGDLVLLTTFGAGLVWGSALIEW